LSKLNGIKLPAVLPFDGVAVERTSSRFYGAGVAPRTLLADAVKELGRDQPEALKAFLLALVLGLRRKEADALEWSAFDFNLRTVTVQPTEWYELKTESSIAVLPIEPEVLALFRGWRAKAQSVFVIESDSAPKSVSYQWSRCQKAFDTLLVWLRSKGVQGQKPIHALRKLYGSAVASQHGIHAASLALRHSDVRVTADHYADSRVRLTAGFASVLSLSTEAPKLGSDASAPAAVA
jgi:integrase